MSFKYFNLTLFYTKDIIQFQRILHSFLFIFRPNRVFFFHLTHAKIIERKKRKRKESEWSFKDLNLTISLTNNFVTKFFIHLSTQLCNIFPFYIRKIERKKNKRKKTKESEWSFKYLNLRSNLTK